MLGLGSLEWALIIAIVFPLWMLVNCLTRPNDRFPQPGTRVIWALVILLTWTLGALVYFFVVYLRRRGAASAAAILLVCTSVADADDSRQRIDFFTKDGQRSGYAIIDRETGRIDLYDRYSNRKGYGTVDGGELFDKDGRRLGQGRPSGGRRR